MKKREVSSETLSEDGFPFGFGGRSFVVLICFMQDCTFMIMCETSSYIKQSMEMKSFFPCDSLSRPLSLPTGLNLEIEKDAFRKTELCHRPLYLLLLYVGRHPAALGLWQALDSAGAVCERAHCLTPFTGLQPFMSPPSFLFTTHL